MTLTYPDFIGRDAVVGVDDERVPWDGARLPDLGGNEDADRSQELKLGLEDAAFGQEAVKKVHCQAEHLRLTILLMNNLKHRGQV